MRRILSVFLAVAGLFAGAKIAFAQTIATINSASPTSVAAGSGDTAITLTLRQSGTTRYNVCFYSGVASAPIAPSAYNFQNANAVTYTLTVPGARFQTGGGSYTNSLYLTATSTATTNGCTGTNAGVSNIFSYGTTAVSYAIRSASPTTTPAGSGATSITFTGTFPTFPTNGTGLGLCFYNGTSNAPLLPTSQSGTASATFSVPAADFSTAGTAKVYLASDTSTCTGVSPGYSSTLPYTVTQFISSSSPSTFPAGSGSTQVTLSGFFSGTSANVCFYVPGSPSTTPITPSSFSSSQIVFTVPAASFQVPNSSFPSGSYTAYEQLGTAGVACNSQGQGISNVQSVTLQYPTLSSSSIQVIPQINTAVAAYAPLPENLEVFGANLVPNVSALINLTGGRTSLPQSAAFINSGAAVIGIPSLNPSTQPLASISSCNNNGSFAYCSPGLAISTYPLAATTTQISASTSNPAPNQAVDLSAFITPGASSTTAGGTFVPGRPTGTLTFYDGTTSLGTVGLGSQLANLTPASTQQIDIDAGTDGIGGTGADGKPAGASANATVRPNETPTPDVNSDFSSLVADFNQDGIPDTLAIQSSTGVLHLFRGGSPLGTIQAEQTIFLGSYCFSLSGITVADLNGDGYPDIAYLCGDSGGYSNLQVVLNQKDGSFSDPGGSIAYDTPNQVAAADVNKDGKIDLVVSGNYGTLCCTGQTFGIRTYLGNGDGTFTSGPLTTSTDIPGTQVVLRDLNNDGIPDLTFLHYNSTTSATEVNVWKGDGTGKFTKAVTLPVCNCTVTKSKLFVTNASPYPDIVVDYAEGSSILAFTNSQNGTISFKTAAPVVLPNLQDVILGAFSPVGIGLAFYDGTYIHVRQGHGPGDLSPYDYLSYRVGTGSSNAISLASAPDLNGDGIADLLVIFPNATSNTSTIQSLVSSSTSTAGLTTSFANGGSHTIKAVYNGDRNVLGSNASLTLTVGQTTPTITWNPASTTITTTPLGSTILNATASVPGSFAYTPAAGSFLAAGTQTITAVFTPTDTNTYSAATTTRNVSVAKTTPTISTTINPGNHTYTPNLATTYSVIVTGVNIVPTGNVQANNSGSPVGALASLSQSGTNQSSTQIVFSSLPAGTFAFTGTYQGDAVYNAVTSAVTNYTVSKSTPTVTYSPTPTTISYGTGLVANQLNASAVDPNTGAAVPGAFTYSTPNISNLQTGSLLPAGANVVTASFVPTDASDYNTSAKTGTITVTKTTPTVTFTPTPASISYGTGLVANQLNATAVDPATGAAVPGSFTYSTPGFTSLQTGSILPAGSNVITASFVPTDTTNYGSASKTATITVITATTTTAISVSPTSITPGQSVRIFITVTPNPSGTAVTGLVNITDDNGPGTQVTLSNGAGSVNYTPANSGTHNLSAAYAGTVNYSPSSSTTPATFAVTKIIPSVTYTPTPVSIVYGTALIASQLNAIAVDPTTSASVPGTFSYSSGTLTNLQPGSMLPTGSNTVTAAFTPSNATYASSSKTALITVTPVSTTTTLAVRPTSIALGQTSTLQATITANSGSIGATDGIVTFTDDRGTIPNSSVQMIGGIAVLNYTPTAVGTHRISAAYAGTPNFSASSTANPVSLLVTQKAPRITYSPAPTSISYGTGLVAGQLNATALDAATGAAIPGVFDYATPSISAVGIGTILPAGANVVTARFTPTDTTSYASATQPATITVTQFTPNIVWATPASIPYGTALSATQLNAVANDVNGTAVPGTYSYNPAAGTVPSVGSTPDTVTFTPTNTTNFATATATRTITVTAGTTATSINLNPASIALGQSTTIGISVTPTVGQNMVFGQVTVSDNRGTITPAQVSLAYGVASITYTPTAVGVHTISVSYPGNSTYAASSSSAPLTITQGVPVITFAPNPASIPYGTPLSAAQLNAVLTTSIPGAFTYSSPLGTILPTGANVITATFTPTDTVNYATVTKAATVTVTQATPAITWNPAANTTTTTPVDATLLNATANVPGTFAYTPALGSFLPAGRQTLSTTFTPTDTLNYATVTTTAATTVAKTATTAVLTANPSSLSSPGTPTALSVLLSGVNITPTGNIQFFDGTTFLGASGLTGSSAHNALASINTTLAAGPHTLFATYNGDLVYLTTTSNSLSYTVGGAIPPVTFTPNPATIPYGTALSAAQLNATSTVPGVFGYSPALNAILPVGVNTITATFTPTDSVNYATVTKTATVTVTQFTPVITWTASTISFGTALSSAQLNAVANDVNGTAVPGTYSYSPAAGTILPVGANPVTVSFTPTNTTNFATATATRTITVIRTATVTTLSINPTSIAVGQSSTITATVTPTSGTGPVTGQVSFTDSLGTIAPAQVPLVNGVATFSYTPTAAGTHVITVSFPNTTNYSASSAGGNLLVGRGVPVINFTPNPATIPYGTPLSSAQLNAVETTGAILGSFSYSSPLGTVLNATANTITATFTPADTANYSTVTKTAVITVTPFTPVITWPTPASIPFGTALSGTQLNAVANDINGVAVPGTYGYSPAAGTVLPLGITVDTVTFTPTNTQNFAIATAARSLTVVAAPTTTTLSINPGAITVGQSSTIAASVRPAVGSGIVTGQVTFSDSRGTIAPGTVDLSNGVASFSYSPTANGTHTITATFTGSAAYAASSTVGTLAVGQGLPVITFAPNPATIPYGTPLSAAQLNAVQTTSIPGVFSYSAPIGALLNAGINTITATFTPTDTAAYATVTKAATVTVTPFTPVITWPPIQIAYGVPLTATQLNAVANDINGVAVPGTYTYNPAAGTLPPVGNSTAVVNFTPANPLNFNPASAINTLTVSRQPVTLTLVPSATTITLGQPVTLTASVKASNTGVPTGTVSFYDSALSPTLITTGTLVNGVFRFVYIPQTLGSHTLNATYSGDLTDEVGLLATANQPILTVNAATQTSLSLALTVNNAPAVTAASGDVLTLTATLATAAPTAYGQVNFCDTAATTCTGVNIVGSAQLNGANTATLRLRPGIGGHTYRAVFLGTTTNVAATSPAAPLLVTGTYPTITTFTSTGATGNFTLTAVVTGTGGPTASPTGTVSFLDTSNGSAPLATASLTNPTLTQSFATQSDAASGVNGRLILAADFDNDGIPDIVTATYDTSSSGNSNQTFTVSRGNGDGTFALKATLPSLGSQVVAGDFNHDGILDLAVSSYATTSVSILFGNGDGTFTGHSTATIPASTGNLLVGDFNHDGILDLLSGSDVYNAATNTTTGTLTALLGAGDGTFSTVSSATRSPASGIVSNDFNNDGIPDLLATGTVGAGGITNTILLGKGDGTFTAKSTFTSQNGGDIFASADLNNDGNADLASVNFYDSSISTYLGKGDGTFTFKATLQNPTANQAEYDSFSIAFADINHDGIPDIATVADDGIFLYNGAGDGTFNLTYQTVPQTDAGENYGLAVADFNNDGFTDVATSPTLFADSSTHVVLALNTVTSAATATVTNVSPVGSGAHQVIASYPGSTSFKSSTSTPINLGGQTFTPILTWAPAPLTLGTPLGAAQLNAIARNTSGALIPGVFAYTPAAGTILPVGRQTLSVTFTPTDLVTFTVATLATTVQVNPLSTATVLTSSANPAAFAAPINLIATINPVGGSSTTPITGSVTLLEGTARLGIVQLANGTATLPISTLSVGTHLLTAVYSGDTAGNYLTSTSPVFTQVIDTTSPILSWTPSPATIVYGTRLTANQLNAVARDATGATIPGVFTYTPAAGTLLSAGAQTLSVSFTPTDAVRYSMTAATAALTVTRATPAIAWNTPAPINQGTPLSTTQLNATAAGIDGLSLPGSFTYNPAAGSILAAGTQTLNVTFTPTDAANYLSSTSSVALTVLNPTTATVLTSSVNPSQFGQPTILTATIAIPTRGSAAPAGNVTFFDGATRIGDPAAITVTSTGATATLSVATLGVGTHPLTAVYANDPNYVTSTSLPLTQTVTIAPVTLAWTPTAVTIPYGTPLSAAQLNAVPVSPFVPNVSGLLTYTPAAGTILSAGSQTLTATFTPSDVADFLSAFGSTVITVTQATPTITWPAPAAIAQGTALSATQLNAVATGINGQSLPGTYTYTPAAGTVLQAGVTALGVTFTPTDTVNYTAATATVPLTVSIPGTVSTIVSSLNPSQSGQSVTFTATVTQTGTGTQPPTGTVTFYDGNTILATAPLTSGSATYATAALSVATHKIRFIYNGTPDYATSTSNTINQVVTAGATRITWAPAPASIVYGTPLSAAQLDAVASSAGAATIPGTFTYAPAAGTVLPAGTQTLAVTFTPTHTVNFTPATATTPITVTKAAPTVTFPTPAAVPVGTILSSTQLAATAAGVTGAALPGTFTYTPAAGTAVTSGPQTLSVLFTPTDTANYTTATANTTLNGSAVTLTALSATTASLGDPAKTITLTGTGFVSDSVARSNGVALATTYVNPTTLAAVLPTTSFRTVQTLQITVNNPTQSQTTSALPFTVSAPAVVIKVNAPPTANPGDQPSITSALTTAYPVDVTGTFNLTFAPISGGVVDPAVQFSTGGTTSAFTIPAGQTTNPNLQIQTGTVAGTITVRLTLTAGGTDVTPTGLAPLVINVPTIAPTITSVTLVRTGRQLTVRTLGFSNTREVTKATFHFIPATGQQIQTPDVTVDVGSIFAGWYSQTASTAYGSTFLYTQTFTLDDDATVVGQVTVTLSNGVGASASGSSQ